MRLIRRMVPAARRAAAGRRAASAGGPAGLAGDGSDARATPDGAGEVPATARPSSTGSRDGRGSTRWSSVGTVVTQSGQGRSRRRRTARGPPCASLIGSPRTDRSSAAASSGRTCFADAGHRELDRRRRRPSPRPTSIAGRVRHELVAVGDRRPASRCLGDRLGGRGVRREHRARPPSGPSVNESTSWPTSDCGSTVGAGSPRTAVSGNDVVPSGTPLGFATSVANWASRSLSSCASAASTSFWRDLGELLARAARRRLRVVHADDVAVVARRDDRIVPGVDVARRTRLDRRDRDLARLALERWAWRRRRTGSRPAGTPPRRS